MKSVLISIKPKYCELIASGKKTIEVRKTRPKIKTPFKCYIYCTYGQENENYMLGKRGKIIGDFVCDKIEELHEYELSPSKKFYEFENARLDLFLKESCLSYNEVCDYRKNLPYYKPLYGWHISDLKIYGKPKELGEFKRWNRTEENAPCAHTKWLYPDCKDCKACNLTRPPQSWCYVEGL